MKTNFKKIALVFCIALLVVAAFAVTAFAVRTEFPDSGYTDITPANGWVLVASPEAQPDEDGEDIDLYKTQSGKFYFNEEKKTVVLTEFKAGEIANYGDWNAGHNGKINMPGALYWFSYWATTNSEKIEHFEVRNGEGGLRCFGYVTYGMNHVVDVKFDESVDWIVGQKSDTGILVGMESLTTAGHGKFAQDGTFTPSSFKENVVDLTGFTKLTPLGSFYDQKPVCYFGASVYDCPVVTEVILPKTLEGVGSYTPSVNVGSSWAAGTETIECATDEWGGQYAGIIAKIVCGTTPSLQKVTIPAEVTVKLIEAKAFAASSVRCITILGKVDPAIVVEKNAFQNVAKGCIIQCATQEDIDIMNKALEAAGATNVKAVDMSVKPSIPAKVTRLPAVPVWVEFVPETSGATAYGSMKSTYSNNWWAYYQDTKTLKFFAKKASSYNEIGSLAACEDSAGWAAYKEEIEHVVVGPYIHKLTASAFTGMTNLKDIEMTSSIAQASGTMEGTPNLTTIFLTGMERVEGEAVFAGAKTNFKINLSGTAVKSINMGSSSWEFIGNIVPGPKTSTIVFDAPSDEIVAYCQENYLNIKDSAGTSFGEWFVEVPEGLPFCGDTAVFDFDEATGTLYILGKGSVADTANYWGGGSKNQFWFDVKDSIKHVVVGDYITTIGKYAFTECSNLETVQLPAKKGFVILNAAFEKCFNLKSIYVKGNQPIEGTFDLSIVDGFESYTFSCNYLVANVIVNENVKKIGVSVFEECVNLAGVYGVPGSYAEEYATKNGLTFYDKATNTPQAVTCTPPAEIDTAPVTDRETDPPATTEPEGPGTTEPIYPDTTVPVEPDTTAPETQPVGGDDDQKKSDGGSMLPVIIVVVVVVVVAVAVAVVLILKKKNGKKSEK